VTNLRLSEATRQAYLDAVDQYHYALQQIHGQAATLAEHGSVGGWPTANHTKENLQKATDKFLTKLESYMGYLKDHKQAVSDATRRMQAEDRLHEV
jgi:hypothetical protein